MNDRFTSFFLINIYSLFRQTAPTHQQIFANNINISSYPKIELETSSMAFANATTAPPRHKYGLFQFTATLSKHLYNETNPVLTV